MRPFVVTDIETTGLSAKTERLIEVAAVRVEEGTITARFESLVNPERSIPTRATKIHGITTGMVYEAPTEDEVMPRYLDFLGNGVLTAHNLNFDKGFLDAALQRQDLPALGNDTLCTLRLARRLLPGLKSKKLSALKRFYELKVGTHHRAMSDAEAAARILKKFLRQLAFEHEIETLDEILSFQHRSYRRVRRVPKPLRHLRENVLPAVPEAPGVYFLKNKRGAVHYIGKAKCLRRRVNSHFNGVEAGGKRQRRLVKATRDVDWETTRSELDAFLMESHLIKEKQPRFNRAGRHYRARPFLRLDRSEAFPRLAWSYRLEDEDCTAEYYGPLVDRTAAEELIEILDRRFRLRECDDKRFRQGHRCFYADLDRCPAPCENGASEEGQAAYAEALAELRAFLCGHDASVLAYVEAKMQRAAERFDYEQAAEERDALERLERFFRRQRLVAAPLRRHHAVLLLPESERWVLHVVRHGGLAETLTVSRTPTVGERAAVEETLARHFDEEAEQPSSLTKREVHEARLLQQWMYRRREKLRQVRWEGEAGAVLAGRVWERLETVSDATVEAGASG